MLKVKQVPSRPSLQTSRNERNSLVPVMHAILHCLLIWGWIENVRCRGIRYIISIWKVTIGLLVCLSVTYLHCSNADWWLKGPGQRWMSWTHNFHSTATWVPACRSSLLKWVVNNRREWQAGPTRFSLPKFWNHVTKNNIIINSILLIILRVWNQCEEFNKKYDVKMMCRTIFLKRILNGSYS
jgi:hypothetical protein